MKFSGNPRLGKWFAFLSALLFLSSASTCGFWDVPIVESEITVAVNVAGLTPDITALYVTTMLNGAAAQQGQDITGRLDRFALALPLATTGHVDIQVVGRSAEKCVVATGTVGVDISAAPPTRYEATVTLAPAPSGARSCTLSVTVTGKGTVTSTPAGISCVGTGDKALTCSGDFPVGQQISLGVTNDPKNYGVLFKGLCAGSGPCNFTFSGPGDVNVGFAGRVCSPADWCWHSPLPQGNTLRAIWGPAADDLWTAGDSGTLLHYNGLTWTAPNRISAATTKDLYAIHGNSSTNIWAVGLSGALIHYDGQNWAADLDSSSRTTATLYGVFAAAANDVWAVGAQGTILHYNGSGWSVVPGSSSLTMATLYTVWGAAANDVWAGGTSGVLLHWNGTAWSVDPKSGMLTSNPIYGIQGTSRTTVMALAYTNVLQYDGSTWTLSPASVQLGGGLSLYVPPSGNAWAVGYPMSGGGGGTSHLSGSTWTPLAAGTLSTVYGVYGSADNDVWAVGYLGAIVHYDGTAWSPAPLSVPLTNTSTIQSLFGTGSADVWAVGSGGLLRHFDGTSWTFHPQSGMVTTNSLYGVWGASPTSMLAIGASGIWLRYDGTNWASIPYSGTATTQYLYGLWGSGTTAWAVGGGGTLVSYNGTSPTVSSQSGMVTSQLLYGIYANGSQGYYAVGFTDTHLRGLWSLMTDSGAVASQYLYGVSGTTTPSNHLWAVGSPGVILHSTNGTTWSPDPASGMTSSTLYHVWVSNANTGWIVGASGTMLKYNGTTWTPAPSGAHAYLYAVWGPNANDVWAGGDYNTLLRYQP